MSKPRKKMKPKRQQCEGKRRFATLQEAQAAARRPLGPLSRGHFMHGYKCKRCGLYHFGHPPFGFKITQF